MATIITDLKESFRRGNIYIQLIYINVGIGFRKNSLWLKILQMSAMKVCFQIAECS